MLKRVEFLFILLIVFFFVSELSMEYPYLKDYSDYSRNSLVEKKIEHIEPPPQYYFSDSFRFFLFFKIREYLGPFFKF
jgi:hypothetical protein